MPGSSIQNHFESFDPSQTRKLPLETWQEIFWLASSIKDTDEFTTNARSYNRTVWDGSDKENVVKAEMTSEELDIALQMRLNITRVCKAWYSMGIKILYSHVRITPHLWDGRVSRRVPHNPQLLSYTKRLTIDPLDRLHHMYVRPAEKLARTTRLCASLPQLRILDAPGDTLLLFPHQNLPNSLKVMIARGYQDYSIDSAFLREPSDPLHTPWRDIRVLKVDLHSLGLPYNGRRQFPPGDLIFASVEELYFNDNHSRDEVSAPFVLAYVSERWKFPKLYTLSIRCFHWPDWWGFLEACAQTLMVLNLTSYGHSFSPHDKEEIEFPELEGLYLDDYEIDHTIVAGKMTRVGWHGVGCFGRAGEDNKSSCLRRLISTFDCWLKFLAAKTHCITGWHEVVAWLEGHPQVIECAARLEERGAEVEFIQVYKKHSYARE